MHQESTTFCQKNLLTTGSTGLIMVCINHGTKMVRRARISLTRKDGKQDGLYESWHENGQMWERLTFKNGEFDGLFEEWYLNGKMGERRIYKNGKIVKN